MKFGEDTKTVDIVTNLMGSLNISEKKCNDIKFQAVLDLLKEGKCKLLIIEIS